MSEFVSLYKPRRHFLPFHGRGERWAVLVCHRRAGKTVAIVNELIERAVQTKKEYGRYSYIAPFYSQAKSVAFDYLMRYSAPFRKSHNVAELQVELFNGNRVKLYGGDNPDALRGLYHDGVGIDEPAQMKPRLWPEVIRPALSDRQGWAVFTGTPAGKNEFYDIWDKAQSNKLWYKMMLKASESGILSQEELDEMRDELEEDEYAQELECSFDAAIRGAYYGRTINEMGARLGSCEWEPTLPVHVSFDIGWRDDTSMWFWQTLRDEVRFIDCYSNNGMAVPDYVAVLREKPYQYGGIWLPHDAYAKTMQTGKSTAEAFMACGIRPQRIPQIGVQQGILATRLMLQSCYIDSTLCEDGVEALRQYQREYDENKRSFKENPRHDWTSHYADAMRGAAVVMKISTGDFQNRMRLARPISKYDPKKAFGGNVQLRELWNQTSRRRNERI